jgi:hypothetical protein
MRRYLREGSCCERPRSDCGRGMSRDGRVGRLRTTGIECGMPATGTEVHDALDPRHRSRVGEIDCVGAPTQQETPEYRAPGTRDPGAWISSPMCSIPEIDAHPSRHDRARELGPGPSPVVPITTDSRSRCSIRWARRWILGCDPARTEIPSAREQLPSGDVALSRAWEPGPMCSGPEHVVLAPRHETLGMSPGSLSMSTHPLRDRSCARRGSASRALRTKDKGTSMAHAESGDQGHDLLHGSHEALPSRVKSPSQLASGT